MLEDPVEGVGDKSPSHQEPPESQFRGLVVLRSGSQAIRKHSTAVHTTGSFQIMVAFACHPIGTSHPNRYGSVRSFTHGVAMRIIVTDPYFPLRVAGHAGAHSPSAAPNDLCVVPTARATTVRGVIVIHLFRCPRTNHVESVRTTARDLKEVFAARALPARRIGSALNQGGRPLLGPGAKLVRPGQRRSPHPGSIGIMCG